ncbi:MULTISPECIES: hypothetical protein [unclassified Microcoleus]|uniref:hypothetical protein n=1 Tax=unclassified Microcoleus TaxID=2642155 RepID=UPI002FCF6621
MVLRYFDRHQFYRLLWTVSQLRLNYIMSHTIRLLWSPAPFLAARKEVRSPAAANSLPKKAASCTI